MIFMQTFSFVYEYLESRKEKTVACSKHHAARRKLLSPCRLIAITSEKLLSFPYLYMFYNIRHANIILARTEYKIMFIKESVCYFGNLLKPLNFMYMDVIIPE